MNSKKFTVRPQIEVNMTQQDIDDIMVAALEGGINYWCREAEVVGEYLGEYASDLRELWDAVAANEEDTADWSDFDSFDSFMCLYLV